MTARRDTTVDSDLPHDYGALKIELKALKEGIREVRKDLAVGRVISAIQALEELGEE